MKKTIFLISLFVFVSAFSGPALSSDHKKGHGYGGHFGDMDLDGNDQVKWEEFKTHFAHGEKKVFQTADKNKDGAIDHDEWHEFKTDHGYGHKK